MDTEKQRQRRHDDARLTKSRNARSEQLLMVPTESLTNRVWLEWISTSKAQLVNRYEISDLLWVSVGEHFWDAVLRQFSTAHVMC